MTKVTFVSPEGAETTVTGSEGYTVMELARANNIDGISAECGGEMMCATCHVYVGEAWLDKVGTASEDEREMLEFASCEVLSSSRLSCQIKCGPELDELVVHLPESQI